MRIFFLLFSLIAALYSGGQNIIGIPHIRNFSKQDYGAGTQNWDIRQDKSGTLYFANNDGLLAFDGTRWKIFQLPKKTNVRSVEIAPDGKIYVGGQEEIGYFSADKRGTLSYTSLTELIADKDASFADVWDVVSFKNSVFFHSSTKIFQLLEGKINTYSNPHWKFMGLSGNLLIAQSDANELLAFQNGTWKPFIRKNSLPKDFMVTSVLPLNPTSSLIITLKNGIYILSNDEVSPLTTSDLKLISAKWIYSACRIDDQKIALATTQGGCFVIDNNGNLLESFSSREGLQNNNVISICLDKDKNLWLGLDNGIDLITYNNAIKHIYPGNQDQGSGYTSLIYQNQLYVGTSNGLYKVPISKSQDLTFIKGEFEPVSETKGQVWNLCEVNDKLLMAHHEGAFLIENNKASLLDSSFGFWTFLPLNNVLPSSMMLAGTYKGLSFFQYQNGIFKKNNLSVPLISARFVAMDDNAIWISHPYKGVFKIQMIDGKPVVKLYTASKGLVSENNNYIYKIKNRVVVATERGLYEYNLSKDAFEPSAYFKNIFGGKSIRYLKEDPYGNIWFISEKNLGVVDMSAGKTQTIYFPELTNKMVNGFEHIYPIDSNNILIGAEKGFYHINYAAYKKNNIKLDVFIRTVKAFNKKDSLLFDGFFSGSDNRNNNSTIEYNWNSLHFDFSSTLFAQASNIEYSYKLEGFDRGWSEWSKKTEKEYTNLPAATYTFLVKARNNFGNESHVDKYIIRVLPPWYQSTASYFIYAILLISGCYLIYRKQKKKFIRQQQKHEEEQQHLQYLHQLEMDKAEKELVQLRNEKLEAEIHVKETELASSALHLVQKSEILSKIKDEFTKLRKAAENKSNENYKKISRLLGEEHKVDKEWENFGMHFDKIHSDFLLTLKHRYPNLTANELKLAAYLRMNFSSKEIAQLINISVRGVELSRHRLRKKLEIPAGHNLFNFLLDVDTPGK